MLVPQVAAGALGYQASGILLRLHQLSPREREVIALLCERFATPDLAARCFLAELTVSTYRRNRKRKLGVHG